MADRDRPRASGPGVRAKLGCAVRHRRSERALHDARERRERQRRADGERRDHEQPLGHEGRRGSRRRPEGDLPPRERLRAAVGPGRRRPLVRPLRICRPVGPPRHGGTRPPDDRGLQPVRRSRSADDRQLHGEHVAVLPHAGLREQRRQLCEHARRPRGGRELRLGRRRGRDEPQRLLGRALRVHARRAHGRRRLSANARRRRPRAARSSRCARRPRRGRRSPRRAWPPRRGSLRCAPAASPRRDRSPSRPRGRLRPSAG
ncbi:putative porin Gram-negative type [Burkholderia pseudomallei]|nr:putative porin Gram-negative type [Burkholderia pseudomallei]